MSLVKAPPHSMDAEQAVLGGLMLDPNAWDRIADKLIEEDFYRKDHRILFRAVGQLKEAGQPCDAVTLAEWLDRHGQAGEAGGVAYAIELANHTPGAANIIAYAQIVREKSVLRQLLDAGTGIAESVYQPEGRDSRELLDLAEREVFRIAEQGSRGRGGAVPIRQVLIETLEALQQRYSSPEDVTGLATGFTDLDKATSGLQPSDLIIIAARPSMGKCLAHDAEILLDDGSVQSIETLVRRGSGVLFSLDAQNEFVAGSPAAYINDGIKPTFEVITRTGRRVVTTLTHPFLSLQGWQPLAELQPGARIAVPRSLPVFGSTRWRTCDVKLLAYLLSEAGQLGPAPGFVAGDAQLAEDFIAQVEAFGGLEFEAFGELLQIQPGANANPLAAWLESLGLTGAGPHALPAVALTLVRPQLALLLRQLFAADGWAGGARNSGWEQVRFASSNEKLARQLQHLLVRFGVIATLRQRGRGRWQLRISDARSLKRFYARIGMHGRSEASDAVRAPVERLPVGTWKFVEKAKRRKSWAKLAQLSGVAVSRLNLSKRGPSRPLLRRLAETLADPSLTALASDAIFWDEIVSITSLGPQQVYDLTIPELHNFVANDVCVHNTAFCMNIAEYAALKSGRGVAVFSMEMSTQQLALRMISSLGRIGQERLRSGRLLEEEWPRVTATMSMLKGAKLFIDDTPALSPTELRARARRLKREHGLGLIVIDYLQLMQVPGSKDNRTSEISEISRSLKAMAKELNVPVIALSQLNRGVEQRTDKRPLMSDLRESGSIEQDADIVAFIYRDDYYHKDSQDKNVAEIIIAKQRNGPTGTTRLRFFGQYTRFDNFG